MIDARRNLFVLSEHAGGTPPWYTKGYGVFQDTPYTFAEPNDFSCVNRGPADAPLFEINHWITNKKPPCVDVARSEQLRRPDGPGTAVPGRAEAVPHDRGRQLRQGDLLGWSTRSTASPARG